MTVPADQATGRGPLAHVARRVSGAIVDRGHWGSCIRTWTVGQLPLEAAVRFGSNAANALNEGNNGISSPSDVGHRGWTVGHQWGHLETASHSLSWPRDTTTSIAVLLPNPCPEVVSAGCRRGCRRPAHTDGQAGVTYDCNDGIKGIDSVGAVGDNSGHAANSGNGAYDGVSGCDSKAVIDAINVYDHMIRTTGTERHAHHGSV